MSSAAAPAATAAVAAPQAPAKGKKKLILVVVAALLVVLLAGGGATVFVLKKRAADAAAEAGEDGAAGAGADKAAHHGPPIFVPLEPFVVNLADKEQDRYAQIGITLEVEDAKFAEEMKLYMPAIRNAILMILAHKQAAELLDRSGKEALAEEIMRESVRPMGIEIAPDPAEGAASAGKRAKGAQAAANPVRRVHFASFIVQ